MAVNNNSRTRNGFFARLGRLLMASVAGEDLRVRRAIASTVMLAQPSHDLESNGRWRTRHDRTANPRVE
jgi:hypothetical protein